MSVSVFILGAGPVGLEAALHASDVGYKVTVFEQGTVAANVDEWSHVRLFSPWKLNTSALARELLSLDVDEEACPTAGEFRSRYLLPLSEALQSLPDRHVQIRTHTRVLGVARQSVLKPEAIGVQARRGLPFVVRVQDERGIHHERADVVIDTTGVWNQPSPMGAFGLAPVGEAAVESHIHRGLPNIHGADFERYRGKRVLVVGDGYCAITNLSSLLPLEQAGLAELLWARSSSGLPYERVENDPLPARDALCALGNSFPRVKQIRGAFVSRLAAEGDAVRVFFEGEDAPESVVVDEIIASVGYRPDTELTRELQIHYCYASEGPMKLAATLMGGGGDCLAVHSAGPETLLTPEPEFFILGSKSYGRHSHFLLKTGIEQVQQVLTLLSDSRPPLPH